MSTTKKHSIADAGFEHDMPNHLPARHNGVSAPGPAVSATTEESENDRENPSDVMPDSEEL
jgi:hypothetical protein